MRAGVVFGVLVTTGFAAIAAYVFGGDHEAPDQADWQVTRDASDSDTVVFTWSAGVYPPMADGLSNEFDKWSDRSSKIVIELNSPGGSEIEGDRVIAVINKIRKTHAVWTYVGHDNDCLSMCVPIYLQGRTRVAAPTSNWLFHDAKSVDKITRAQTVMYSNEQGQANLMFFYKYIDRSDINPEWRKRLQASMKIGDVWKTGQELKDERSNIITILE